MIMEITVEYAVEATVNVGNFENIKPGYRLSAKTGNGMDAKDVRNELKALADGWLEEDVDEIRKG